MMTTSTSKNTRFKRKSSPWPRPSPCPRRALPVDLAWLPLVWCAQFLSVDFWRWDRKTATRENHRFDPEKSSVHSPGIPRGAYNDLPDCSSRPAVDHVPEAATDGKTL